MTHLIQPTLQSMIILENRRKRKDSEHQQRIYTGKISQIGRHPASVSTRVEFPD
jgi:hypothetical protein